MSRPLVGLALVLYLVLGLLPLAVMLARVEPADLAALGDARTLTLLGRTLVLGLSVAGIALALGLAFGFLVARTDVPGAAWMRALGVLPLFIPPLFLAMAWCAVVPSLRGTPAAAGVLGLSTFPLVATFAARAFERVDARAEDAARLAGGLRAALRMEMPLVMPAALAGACLAFAFAVNDFGVPDYVTSLGGPKVNVYADEIFFNWNQRQEPGRPVATALPLILLTAAALLPALALRRRGAMASLAGNFRAPSTLALGRWRWPAFALALAILSAGALIPLGRLAYESGNMPRHAAELGLASGAAWSAGLETARASFARALELARADLRNSLVYAALAAAAAVPLGLVLGHAIERARPRLGRALELVVVLPLAAPAILFGIGIITLWNHDATAALYDSPAIAVILLVGRFAAFPVLITAGAAASLDPRLEEAARLAGAGPARRLSSIVAPCVSGALAGGFVLAFVLAMRDLDAAILVPAMNKTAILRAYNMVHFGRDAHVAALCLLLVFAVTLPALLWTLFTRRRLEVLP